MPETTTCPRCERTFHDRYDDMRFRSGTFVEGSDEYGTLCEDCHREVVRS